MRFFLSHKSVRCGNKQLGSCVFISVGVWQCILLIYSNLICILLPPVLLCEAKVLR